MQAIGEAAWAQVTGVRVCLPKLTPGPSVNPSVNPVFLQSTLDP